MRWQKVVRWLALGVLGAYLTARPLRRGLKLALLGGALVAVALSRRIAVATLGIDALTGMVLEQFYQVPAPPPVGSNQVVQISVRGEQPAATLTEPILGFAIDTSQVVGGRWWSKEAKVEVGRGADHVAPFDFRRPRLLVLAEALAPARLRIGGTEADHVFYAERSLAKEAIPPGYEYAFTEEHWLRITDFTNAVGFSLIMTVNAGPGPRDERGRWQPDNARRLIGFARRRAPADVVWEFGNEVNAYWFIHGLSHRVGGAQYAEDFTRFGKLVHGEFPQARLAGPAGFLWPIMGEPWAGKLGIFRDFLASASPAADIITWHYYPQQSRRCPMATRRAGPEVLLDPHALDETQRWADYVERLTQRHAPASQVWLGESGNAQCGGEPGVSDRFVSSLWYLDQLGAMALRGQPMIRQTLVGSDYGMLDPQSLTPRPDYWAALLVRKYVGQRMLAVHRIGENAHLRSYAACASPAPGRAPGTVAIWLINLHPDRPARFALGEGELLEWHQLTAPEPASRTVLLDGKRLELEGGRIPAVLRPVGERGVDALDESTTAAPPSRRDHPEQRRTPNPAEPAPALPSNQRAREASVLELAPASYGFALIRAHARACH